MKQHEDMKEYYQSYESDYDVDQSSCTKSNESDDKKRHKDKKENFLNYELYHDVDNLTLSTESQSSNDSFAILIQQHCMPDCRATGMASLR
jgi:hypothetical protein